MTSLLPPTFSDLESYCNKWCIAGSMERLKAREGSSMEELESFYAAALPRMEQIIEHLNAFPPDGLSGPEMRLYQLAESFFEASLSVELFHEPAESGVYPADKLKLEVL